MPDQKFDPPVPPNPPFLTKTAAEVAKAKADEVARVKAEPPSLSCRMIASS